MNDQLPIVWDKASNFYIYDNAGNQWIDFTSSIFVANVGHSNPMVIKAIENQIHKSLINSYYYPTQERTILSEMLLDITPKTMDKVLFLSTGSESVECAIKMAINYTGRKKILSFDKAFHGKTMGASMACGKGNEWVPTKNYVDHLPYPNIWDIENGDDIEFLKNSIKNINLEDYAACIIEPYQGWSASFPPNGYMKYLKKLCEDNGLLLIIDEIQSGFGRTGKMFAFEHFDIVPDIITCGKAISSSLPLSCVITNSKISNTCMSYNSTHGSNPVAVAASSASLKFLIESNLVYESERKGKILGKILEEWKKENPINIGRISQRGLLASVFIHNPKGNDNDFVDRLIEVAMRKGLMSIRTASGTLKIGPPLTITDEALIEGIEVLKESLVECLDTLG
tara:strand:+ start:10143 stop:11333 length:1191 start_codon:yes stop_codon:yes gene_type:complete